MMKKFVTGIIHMIGRGILFFTGVLCVIAIFFAVAVAALDMYYDGVFPIGVFLCAATDNVPAEDKDAATLHDDLSNSLYCTGMTVQEVADVFDSAYDLHADKVIVQTLDGKVHELPFDEYGITVSFEPAVARCLQNYTYRPYQWFWDGVDDALNFVFDGKWSKPNLILNPTYPYVYPEYQMDVSVMKAKLLEQDWLNENLYDPENTVSIVRNADAGFVLVDETRDLLLREETVELICATVANKLSYANDVYNAPWIEIDLSDDVNRKTCYQSIPYTDEMKDTLSKWEGINNFQNFHLTYQFGDCEEVIDESVVADWMALDEYGNILFDENDVPVLDETMIAEYVAYLAATYNTVGIEREFQATRGEAVTVAGGSYGNKLDEKAEYAFLLKAFMDKKGGTREPEYISEAKEKGANDIGDTYIEVDMGMQHMYYYVDGALAIDTPVVTGNAARNWNTPAKVCYVYFKQRNRVLHGANYATPVKYWMAVDGHIGIHDATWRKEFGGEIYKTNGSHGCINTPYDIMSELYDMVEVGTPVIMFY